MFHLEVPKIECIKTEGNFAQFVAEPMEKGFGVTLGNALRRVLLGYLPGAAVTRISIEGIQHEFTAPPYMKEDITEFILNVKALRLRALSGQPGKLTLDISGEKQIYAADITPSTDFEIANPELYLATLDSPEARLYVEFEVELGVGYKVAEPADNLPIGVIPIDAVFTPVRKVNFTTEPMHFGRESSHERLNLEVWTDGTISPTDALSQAARTMIEQLSPFVDYVRLSHVEQERAQVRPTVPDDRYNMPVEQLDLSVRTMNCLRRAGIATVGELVNKGEKELLSLRNFGQKSMQEIEEHLKTLGLSLAPDEEI